MANVEIHELTLAELQKDSDVFAIQIQSGNVWVTRHISRTSLATHMLNTMEFATYLDTTADTVFGAINELKASSGAYTELTGNLTIGSTTLVFTDNSITSDSTIDWYTSNAQVAPTNVVVDGTNHTVTFTFIAQENPLGVKVVIK